MTNDEKQKLREALNIINERVYEAYDFQENVSNAKQILESLLEEPQTFYPGQRVVGISYSQAMFIRMRSKDTAEILDFDNKHICHVPIKYIKPDPDAPLMVEIKKHDGGECPVSDGTQVIVHLDDRWGHIDTASHWDWESIDVPITYYIVLPKELP